MLLARRSTFIVVSLIAALFVVGCNEITSSNEQLHDDRNATVTANVAATIGSTTLNSSYISEALAVQDAMDRWMADSDERPNALDEPTDDLSTSEPALSPEFLDIPDLECRYTWDSQGRTKQHC